MKKPIGELLADQGVLGEREVRKVHLSQTASGERFATECLRSGYASEQELLEWLSLQAGVPGIAMSTLILPLRFLEHIPRHIAVERRLLPVRVDTDMMVVASADPTLDPELQAELAFRTGRRVLNCVALDGPLSEAIEKAYAAKERGELEYRARPSGEFEVEPRLISAEVLTQVPIEVLSSGEMALSEISTADLGQVEAGQADDDVADEPRVRPRGRRVLLIEDDPDSARLISRVLKKDDFVVEVADRGLAGLNILRKAPPDLLILDAMLPEVHGFDIAKKVKGSERYRHIPIIMMSSIYRGWRIAEDLQESYRVEAFLEKPFKIDTFIKTVDRLMARGAKRRRPATGAVQAYREGMACYRREDLDGAIERMKEALRADPLSAKLHYQLGVLFLKKRGMIYQAMQVFEQAVELEPRFFVALRSLAVLYQRRGFRNKAIEMWERALQCSPDSETAARLRRHVRGLL